MNNPKVAIVDYGVGNLFSIKHVCEHSDLQAIITSSKEEIIAADAVILPGVGAFGDAMEAIRQLDLVQILQTVAKSPKPFIGICLGMHLLMTESNEFGHHQGLDIIKGSVVRFDSPIDDDGRRLKVPHVGWNHIYKVESNSGQDWWGDSMLEGLANSEFMYFVHSFYVRPENAKVILSVSYYGDCKFCSSLQYRNIFACQFHPERSGPCGQLVYKNIASFIRKNMES